MEERPELEFRKFMVKLIYEKKDDKINEFRGEKKKLKGNFNEEI